MVRQGTDYRDERNGAYDAVSATGKRQPHQVRENISPHQAAQWGADVRSQSSPPNEEALPEGLVRPRKGPYSRKLGRRSM
jgi:hypothetical protein